MADIKKIKQTETWKKELCLILFFTKHNTHPYSSFTFLMF